MDRSVTWAVDFSTGVATSEAGLVQFDGGPKDYRVVRARLLPSFAGAKVRLCHDALHAIRGAWAAQALERSCRLRSPY
ncbi:hypothetical protein [Azospirillum rugosum]|uniref:Transposase n=1 Tax=Azospirillum rugosum TaxID=416170 RepID=A0ABS4SMH1_9PROT|nr:hypothetical protein [Azospirillum rugosum]MBP2293759.1 hypothetical protein [Azospirillum rugosum]MDQ0527304.1 hypothetical protein [Azospirillum rugosum]